MMALKAACRVRRAKSLATMLACLRAHRVKRASPTTTARTLRSTPVTLLDGGAGYCTNVGCAANECMGGYACDTVAMPTYCARPPDGAGKSCASDADCAGTEATWCDIYQSHVCYVQGCEFDWQRLPRQGVL